MTMIHGGAATSPNKDFLKTKHHHIFLASQFCYDVRHLSFYEPIMWLVYIVMLWMKYYGKMTGAALISFKAGVYDL